MKKNSEQYLIARSVYDFLYNYAPDFLTRSQHTLKSYSDTLAVYVSFLESEGVNPSDLNRKHFEKTYIEKWIMWMKKERNCSPETCNIRLGNLRVFLEYLGTTDISLLYLSQEAKTIKRQKCMKKKVSGLTRESVTAIMNEIDLSTTTGKRDYTFISLMYATAARIGELLSLKLSDVHLESNKPYITLCGKGGKIRTAYLLPRIKDNLSEYIRLFHKDNSDTDSFLFYSRVGGKRGKLTEPAIDKRIKLYASVAHQKCHEVPINTHAHQFRHAKATHWLEDGINIVQISFLLGHQNLETTMKYLDITNEDKISALATIEYENAEAPAKKWKDENGKLSDFLKLRGI